MERENVDATNDGVSNDEPEGHETERCPPPRFTSSDPPPRSSASRIPIVKSPRVPTRIEGFDQ